MKGNPKILLIFVAIVFLMIDANWGNYGFQNNKDRSLNYTPPEIIYHDTSRPEDVSYTRPTTITVNATDWQGGLPTNPWTVEDNNISATWTPATGDPDGNYRIQLTVVDSLGNTNITNETVTVYNEEEKIVNIRLLDFNYQPISNVAPGQEFFVEANIINLENSSIYSWGNNQITKYNRSYNQYRRINRDHLPWIYYYLSNLI